MATTWNGSDKSTHITLSTGNHVATSVAGSGNEGVRGTTSKSSGKWYLEYPVISFGGFGGGILGFGDASYSLTGGLDLTHSFGVRHNGALPTPGTMGSAPDGKVVSIAVDLTSELIWVRYDAGNWNNDAGADPAAGTNGLSISGFHSGAVFPLVWLQFNPCNATINAGDSAFVHSVPSGFTAWDSTPPPEYFSATVIN